MNEMKRLDGDTDERYKNIMPFQYESANNKRVVMIPFPAPKKYRSFRCGLNGDDTHFIEKMVERISKGISSDEEEDCKKSIAAEWIFQAMAKDYEDELISIVKKLGLSVVKRFAPERAAAMMADANMSYKGFKTVAKYLRVHFNGQSIMPTEKSIKA